MLPYSLKILRAMFDARCHWKPSLRVRQGYDHVRRLKNGKPSVHPLRGDEVTALRELLPNRHLCSPPSAAAPSLRRP